MKLHARSFLPVRLFAASLATLFVVAGCGSDDASSPDPAKVRVLHASADAPNVDVNAGSVRLATNAPFGAATAFAPVSAGQTLVTVAPTGTTTNVISETLSLESAASYTVIAAGRVANIAPIVFKDDATAPAAGALRLRVVHASPVAGNVDVYVTAPTADLGTPLLANVPFRTVSGVVEVPAGTYRIRVTATGSRTPVYDSGSVPLAAGANLVAVAIDRAAGASPIQLAVLTTDANTPKLDLPDTRTSLRAVHASPNAPAVDILVDNAVALSNVPFPVASNYLPVPSGSRNVKVNAAGTSTTVIDNTSSYGAGRSYTLLAVNFLASIEPLLVEDRLAFPAPGQAQVRVIHASPDAPNVDVLAGTTRVLSNVPFKAASDYLTVPAGQATFNVNVAGTSTTATSATVTLAAGKVYTVIAVGSLAGVGGQPLRLIVLTDR